MSVFLMRRGLIPSYPSPTKTAYIENGNPDGTGVYIIFEDGMTWGEFLDSDYNKIGLISGSGTGDNRYIVRENDPEGLYGVLYDVSAGTLVRTSHTIKADGVL